MIFVTADTHLGHANVIKHCKRPFKTIEEHDAALIDNWNSIVPKKATVIIAGDFAWKNHNYYIQALNGKKILVKGNHDKMSKDSYSNFTAVYDGIWKTTIDKQSVTFGHYCMTVWGSSCHGAWLLYGHSHGRLPEYDDKFAFDCGVDIWDYKPVSWETVKYVMSKRVRHRGREADELDLNTKLLRERNLQYLKELEKHE